MLLMVRSFWVSRAIYVAADLGLADLLKDEPKSSEELAQATATHAPSLYRLMRSLAKYFATSRQAGVPNPSCGLFGARRRRCLYSLTND
jgi:hypothetical protein